MTAKALRNPDLRKKFKVGDTFRIPNDVWKKLATQPTPVSPSATVVAVGDKIIEHGKNRLCRFVLTINSQRLGTVDIWEEWMLERLTLMYATEEAPQPEVCRSCGQTTPG